MANNFDDKVMYVEPNYTGAYYEDDRFGDSKVKYELAPDLSDYCIAVDLTVECKGRTVGVVGNNNDNTITMSWQSSSKTNNISFHKGTTLHFNGVDNTDGYINALTTSYVDTYYLDIVKNGTNEMFGITSIDIQYNNYFVPEITIEFVDIKGVSLFAPEELRHSENQDGISGFAREDIAGSFFKSFFSFPYPKYTLMVKGFYGRPVTYELTCADFRAKFDSNTGNFNATARFIGYAYSLLNDVTLNCLLVAPYSDYVGKSYWENKLSSTFRVYDKSGNSSEMPTLIKLIELMDKARTKEAKMSYDNPLYNEKNKLDNITTLLNLVTNDYVSYVNALKTSNIDYISDVNNKFVILLFSEENQTLLTKLGDNSTIEDIRQKYKTLNSDIINLSNTCGFKLTNIPDDFEKVPSEQLFTQISNSSLLQLNTSISEYSLLSDEIKDRINVKLNDINNKKEKELKYCTIIKDNGFTDFILTYQPQHNSKVENNDKSISEYREGILYDVLGFKPTVENIMRIIMAHFETYMHMLINVMNSIKNNPRTLSTLGLGSLYTDVNANVVEVPPFPKCSTLKNNKAEDDWLGNYSNTPEVDLIHGLLNGASMTNSILESSSANSPQNGFATNIPYPFMLSDINIDENLFSEFDDFSNTSDVVGHIALRMMNTIGVMNIKSNKDKIAKAIAKADAKNFFKFNPRPNDIFLAKLKTNIYNNQFAIDVITNNSSKVIQDNKVNNVWAWDGNNLKSKALFEKNGNDLIFSYYKVTDEKSVYNYINPLSYKSFKSINSECMQDVNGECQVPSDLTYYTTSSDVRKGTEKITKNDNIFKIFNKTDYINQVINQFAITDDDDIKEIPTLLNMQYNKDRYEDLCKFNDSDDTGYGLMFLVNNDNVNLVPYEDNRVLNSVKRTKTEYEKNNIFDRNESEYPITYVYGEKNGKLTKLKREDYDKDAILENPNNIVTNTLIQFYGLSNSDKTNVYLTSYVSLFGQYCYYLQSNVQQKAFLYALSLSHFYDMDNVFNRLISDDYPYEYVPKMAIVLLGGLIWRYKEISKNNSEALNCDSIFTVNALNDNVIGRVMTSSNYKKLTENLRNEIKESLYEEFISFCDEEFPNIRNNYELKLNNGVVTPDYIKWFSTALASSDGFNNGKSVGDMLDYESNDKLSSLYINLEDYLTKNFSNEFFANYISLQKCNNPSSSRMYGIILYNRENTQINIDVSKSIYQSVLISKGTFFKQNTDNKKSIYISNNLHTIYLQTFFDEIKKLYSNLTNTLVVTANNTPQARVTQTDVNIKIALYNYCKIVYDRWVAGQDKLDTWDMENFFEKYFYFIDSYYNKIGQDVKINMDSLKEKIIDSQTQKAYTMLSFITDTLVQSRMQFVCLQNFSDLSNRESLEDMFKPIPYSEMPTAKEHPDFVTIYTYEPSRHLNINGDYTDDSFMLSDAIGYPEAIKYKKDNEGYKIPAFGVSYGKMYQSYFQDIQVSMESPIVTEQAIKAQLMLCNQANNQKSDDGNNGLYIGQDLYTIYSNNSYTCTVKMLGCAWVQPLMYFVLLNVPMFKGSYLIESVSHHIEAGQMYTTFVGVRMAKTSTPIIDGYYITETNKGSSNGIGGYGSNEEDYLKANINNNCPYKPFPVSGNYQGEPTISLADYTGTTKPLPKYPQYETLEDAIVCTVYAEAGNQDELGIKLVAAVIMNRYAKKKKWSEVLFKPQHAIGDCIIKEIEKKPNFTKVKNACYEVCVNGMCSALLGQRTTVNNPVYIYSLNKNTGVKTKSVEITVEHLQKLGAYCTVNGYGKRIDNGALEKEPKYWRSAEYILQHESGTDPLKSSGHVFTGQDNSATQSLYWKQVSSVNKKTNGISEYAQGLFDAITQTVNYTESLKCTLNVEGNGDKIVITSPQEDKLAGVFDAILNTYYNHISRLFWVIEDNAQAYNPKKIFVEVRNGKLIHPIIAIVTESDNKYTYNIYKSYNQLSPNFLLSLHKKYGEIDNMALFKNECLNFATSSNDNENEIRNMLRQQSIGDCALVNNSNDSSVSNLKLSENELIKKCARINVTNTENANGKTWDDIVKKYSSNGISDDVHIIGVRSKLNYNGMTSNNQFNDACVICYKDNGKYLKLVCEFTTVPGLPVLQDYSKYNNNGATILQTGNYNSYTIGYHKGEYKAVVENGNVNIYVDNTKDSKFNYINSTSGNFGINIHKSGNPQSDYVNNWSAGCQVFKRLSDFNKLMSILSDKNPSKITYTLVIEDDLE